MVQAPGVEAQWAWRALGEVKETERGVEMWFETGIVIARSRAFSTPEEQERFEAWNATDQDDKARATRVRWGLVVDLSPADLPLASLIADEVNAIIERHGTP